MLCRPWIRVLNPVTNTLPVLFILAVGMLKDGYEDYLRSKADKKINGKPVRVYRNGKFTYVSTDKVRVGDFVILRGF